jgi:hypothetical protein
VQHRLQPHQVPPLAVHQLDVHGHEVLTKVDSNAVLPGRALDPARLTPLVVDPFVIVGATAAAAAVAWFFDGGSLVSAAAVTALLAGWSSAWSP